jgi:hypothetical protein
MCHVLVYVVAGQKIKDERVDDVRRLALGELDVWSHNFWVDPAVFIFLRTQLNQLNQIPNLLKVAKG